LKYSSTLHPDESLKREKGRGLVGVDPLLLVAVEKGHIFE
jgi:hypothetical protein